MQTQEKSKNVIGVKKVAIGVRNKDSHDNMCMAKFKCNICGNLVHWKKWTHARWKHIGKILKFKIFTPFQVSKRGEWGKLWERRYMIYISSSPRVIKGLHCHTKFIICI